MSQTKFHHIRITKSKVIHVQIPVPNWEKTKKWETSSGLQNGAMRGVQIGAGFRGYKSGHKGLQIGAALGISNRGREITNWVRDFKLGQRDFKSGQEALAEMFSYEFCEFSKNTFSTEHLQTTTSVITMNHSRKKTQSRINKLHEQAIRLDYVPRFSETY